jgi:hypothetical protein
MSIKIDNLRITKLREYLMNLIEKMKLDVEQLNVNFLSNEINNYSLDKIGVIPQDEEWITGTIIYKDVYNFTSRMNYSADTITNLENIGFYEIFEKLIKQKNDANDLPDIEGIESIQCLNAGTMRMANTNTAEFSIQIQITYREV